ncbi:ganglioside GM2 activator-like [Mytilus trossulus]|uniref:ganglioside GM2 activator-like n=1 Tax=Mytilus trossulus TaxID=6551 RepID=UPI0030072571
MEKITWILLFSIGGVLAEYTSLQVSNCNKNSNTPSTISHMSISPMPVTIPGNFYFSADMKLTRPVGESSMEMSIKRKTYWFDIPIPCILRVGSCRYNNLCTMVDDMITHDWAGLMGNIGNQIKTMLQTYNVTYNQCPQQPRTLSIRNYLIRMPDMPSVLSWFAAGDYSANIRVQDNISHEELLCLDVNLSLKKACSGFRCYFGK